MRAKEVNFSGERVRNLRMVRLIGQGNWADVYLAEDWDSGEKAAVKVTPLKRLAEVPKLLELVRAEIAILRECRNANVVRLLADFAHADHQFIVLEYCSGFELGEVLQRERRLEEPLAVNYLKQILNGFKGLHEVRAMHRDFKAENVMLHEGLCKIVDLGFGKQLACGEVARTKLGSNLTMAPEVMQGLSYDFRADIWSIGVVFYQMLYGRFPIQARTPAALLQKARDHDYSLEGAEVGQDCKDFIARCLTFDPDERISWADIYRHPLVADQNNELIVGPPQSKINVEENGEFYERGGKELEREVAPPAAVKASLIRPPSSLIRPPSSLIEDRIQQPIQEQFEREPSQIFLSAIKEEAQIDEMSHEQERRRLDLARRNEELSEEVLRQERWVLAALVRDIKYRYMEELADIEFISRYALTTMRDTHSQCEINHTPVICLLLKDAYLRLGGLDDAINFGKNLFSFDPVGFKLFQDEQEIPQMVKQHMATCRETFEQYCGFLSEEEYRDGRLRTALRSISSQEDFPDYILDEYLNNHARRISNAGLSENWNVQCRLLKLAFCLVKYSRHKHHHFSRKRILAALNNFNCERAHLAELRKAARQNQANSSQRLPPPPRRASIFDFLARMVLPF